MKHATRLIAASIRLKITRRYWLNSTIDNHIHNHPNRDTITHEAVACPCGPTDVLLKDEDGDDCWGVQHHSLDGRENT